MPLFRLGIVVPERGHCFFLNIQHLYIMVTLKKLTLENFGAYARVQVSFDENVTYLMGPNRIRKNFAGAGRVSIRNAGTGIKEVRCQHASGYWRTVPVHRPGWKVSKGISNPSRLKAGLRYHRKKKNDKGWYRSLL